MKTLVVRQTGAQGHLKTWRLHPEQGARTFGDSRLADLFSLDPEARPFEGVLEFREGQWYWLGLHADRPLQLRLDENARVRLGTTELTFEFHERPRDLAQRLAAIDESDGRDLELVLHHGRLLSSRYLGRGEARAASTDKPGCEILYRRVANRDTRGLLGRAFSGLDRDSRRSAGILIGCSVLAISSFLFGPRGTPVESRSQPTQEARVITMAVPNQVKKGSVLDRKLRQQPQRQPASIPDKPSAAPAGGKVAGLFKAVESGRLTKLLGKVSAQAARSAEVVVAKGVRAGEGASGRALAALGQVDRGGKDWSGAAQGTGVTVSTSGKGGGGALAGVGLAAGRTGQGGVGLVEDESEIVGGLDREIIAQVIKSQLGQILYCYERQLSANPDLFGKVAVRFTIGPSGSVETQTIGDTTLRNSTVEGCILTKVAGWKFPAPLGGTKVMVTYPFLFKSTN